ncbi:hypothetical protein SB766_11350, partial [Pseudomonas sp. SIMBA_077]
MQAASCKLQAASCKLQAASCKLQAASCKSVGDLGVVSSARWDFSNMSYEVMPIFRAHKQNPCLREQTGVLEFNLDDDLLSHG